MPPKTHRTPHTGAADSHTSQQLSLFEKESKAKPQHLHVHTGDDDPWCGTIPGKLVPCPFESVRAHNVSTVTGEMVPVIKGCDRWSCPGCGPRLLRQHMAHFKDRWGDRSSGFVFVTLTLRPVDVASHTPLECAETLRKWFSTSLLRRIQRREGARPLYLAQVDFPGREQHPHLHALIETNLSAPIISGMWADIGGGIDSDVNRLGGTADDVARTAGYIVKASRWNSGRILCSQGHGFNTADAKRERRRYAIAAAGEPEPNTVFLYEVSEERRPRAPRYPIETFDGSKDAPTDQKLAYTLPGGHYRLRRTFDPIATEVRVVVEEEVGRGQRRRYRKLAFARRREVAERYLHRFDTRKRQSWTGR